MKFKKSDDGQLEIEEDPIINKISIEEIESIIAEAQAEKDKSLSHIASLDESIAYYSDLKLKAENLGVKKVVDE